MYLFFDVETTGLPKRRGASYRDVDNWPRIVSISWAIGDAEQSLALHKYAVIRPDGFSIPADATRIHGITNAYAKQHGQPLAKTLDDLDQDLRRHQPSLAVAHNVDFDRNVLLAEMLRTRRSSPLFELPVFCTMQETVDLCRLPGYRGRYKWPTLDELHRTLFGRGFDEAHNAAADVLACARCYFALRHNGSPRKAPAPVAPPDDDDETGDAQDLIGRILAWAEDHPSFDTSFVDSLQEKLDRYGYLTPGQLAALENIAERWHVDE